MNMSAPAATAADASHIPKKTTRSCERDAAEARNKAQTEMIAAIAGIRVDRTSSSEAIFSKPNGILVEVLMFMAGLCSVTVESATAVAATAKFA